MEKTQWNLPTEYTERMRNMLGEEFDELLKSCEGSRHRALRLNRNKPLPEDEAYVSHLTRVPWENSGFYYDEELSPGKHPFHDAGAYYIQEPSAMAPVAGMNIIPGEKILDLCAAPGGKSTQIAGYLQGEGLLVSNEINRDRCKILSENMERMGVVNGIVVNETPDRLAEHFQEYFDGILVDAPCSGEGMFRKNEEALVEWSPDNVKLCADRQDDILESAATMLKTGGRLMYSTCTFAPDEDEGTIFRFIKAHPEFYVESVSLTGGMEAGRFQFIEKCEYALNATPEQVEQIGKTVRLWPHKVRGEGHFMALLRKGETLSGTFRGFVRGGVMKGISLKDAAPFMEFQKKHLYTDYSPLTECFLMFGENLYMLPKDAPNLKGLKVMRPGLMLGTYLKNRFEPAHALAMSLTNAVNKISFPADSPEILSYLRGDVYRPQGENGDFSVCLDIKDVAAPWTLVMCNHMSCGWAKHAGDMYKNHYPRGLRRIN